MSETRCGEFWWRKRLRTALQRTTASEGEAPVVVIMDDDWIFDSGALSFPADDGAEAEREVERFRQMIRNGPVEVRRAALTSTPTEQP